MDFHAAVEFDADTMHGLLEGQGFYTDMEEYRIQRNDGVYALQKLILPFSVLGRPLLVDHE